MAWRLPSPSDVPFPQQASDSSGQHGRAPWPYFTSLYAPHCEPVANTWGWPPRYNTPLYVPHGQQITNAGSNAAYEEYSAQQFAREEGGKSQDHQGFRHGLTTPWQTGVAPKAVHANGGVVTSSVEGDEDHHCLRESHDCTAEHLVVPTPGARTLMHQEQSNPQPSPAMTEYSQPTSVQSVSTTCSAMEEEASSTTVQGVFLPNLEETGHAVKLYKDLCSTMNELCVGHELPIHGRQAVKRHAQFMDVETDGIKLIQGQVCVPLRVPFPSTSVKDFLESRGILGESAGLWIMQALYQYFNAVSECHSNPNCTGALYGAFPTLSNILTSYMTKKGAEPLVCLMPFLNTFLEPAKKVMNHCSEEEVVRKGRLQDIKALGHVLFELLPYIRDKVVHVSGRVQKSLEQAERMCEHASTGDQMAFIARTLHCDTPLSTLYINGFSNTCTIDIVCLEGDTILQVFSDWLKSCGPRNDPNRFKLHYTSPPYCRVLSDQQVCYPQSTITASTTGN